ncbi:uncharacterized protein LOC111781410 isoform X1 [Cucurbita pepo subsp. pepo]|uniref:uncharacterized protein LOC111781410 isoform X1 n=1 Tax=Cucurbita pepo subsp. pepo TaxID=3664 RepID=UPI000C9D2CC1|nr:uncharacterized protein LOC111781410 isoform X1 [Cucurbita pepo subsp. pepo]
MNPMINKCFNILLEVLNFTRTKHRDFDCIVAKAKANQQELHLWSGVVRFRKEMVHLPWYKIIGTILRDMIFQKDPHLCQKPAGLEPTNSMFIMRSSYSYYIHVTHTDFFQFNMEFFSNFI